MNIVVPIIVLSGIGAVMGIGLAIASRVFAVDVDPRVEELMDNLPGANCGACGYPGCSGYAKALVNGDDITLCTPGGNSTIESIAAILGVDAVAVAPQTALVNCAGGRRVAPDRSHYMGPMDCRTAVLVASGTKGCRWGCVGLGTCAEACDDNAIAFTDDGLAYVLPDSCIACKKCLRVCPRGIIAMVPKERKVHVLCSSQDPGKNTKSVCQVGCIACKQCARKDAKSFTIENNCAYVNYADGVDVPVSELVCTPGAIWNMDNYNLLDWLTDPTKREDLKERQAAHKAEERAKRAAAKKKAAAAKAAREKKAAEKEAADDKPDDEKKAAAKPADKPAEKPAPDAEPKAPSAAADKETE